MPDASGRTMVGQILFEIVRLDHAFGVESFAAAWTFPHPTLEHVVETALSDTMTLHADGAWIAVGLPESHEAAVDRVPARPRRRRDLVSQGTGWRKRRGLGACGPRRCARARACHGSRPLQ